jgi:hypothetical protein
MVTFFYLIVGNVKIEKGLHNEHLFLSGWIQIDRVHQSNTMRDEKAPGSLN